jgi:hypothetical protein
MHQQNAGADADSKKRHSTRSKLVDSRRNAQFVQTLNFFIGRENITDLVRRHALAHDRVKAGRKFLSRFGHPVPMARHSGFLFGEELALRGAEGRAGAGWLCKGRVVTTHQFDRADTPVDPVRRPDRLSCVKIRTQEPGHDNGGNQRRCASTSSTNLDTSFSTGALLSRLKWGRMYHTLV